MLFQILMVEEEIPFLMAGEQMEVITMHLQIQMLEGQIQILMEETIMHFQIQIMGGQIHFQIQMAEEQIQIQA